MSDSPPKFVCPECSKICLSQRGLDQHLLIHSGGTSRGQRKRYGAAKASLSSKKQKSKPRSAMVKHEDESVSDVYGEGSVERSSGITARSEATSSHVEGTDSGTHEESEATSSHVEGNDGAVEESEATSSQVKQMEWEESESSSISFAPKRKYTKRKHLVSTTRKRKRVFLISEECVRGAETNVSPISDSPKQSAESEAEPSELVTLVVESDTEEEDGKEHTPPELQLSTSENIDLVSRQTSDPTVEVLKCVVPQEELRDCETWLDDINSINIKDLSFEELVPADVLEESTAINVEGTEDTFMQSAVHSVVDIFELALHDAQPAFDFPDFEEEGYLHTLESDYLIMNPFSEEDPYDDFSYEDTDEEFLIVPEHNFELLLIDLASALPSDWVVSSSKHAVRISLLSPYENVSVQLAVSWNGKEFRVFVNNKELPKNNFIWNTINEENPEGCCDISDKLIKLCYLVGNSSVCKGVRLYSDLWKAAVDKDEGVIEEPWYQEVACLRDVACSLLLPGKEKCQPCCKRSSLLRHRSWRAKKDGEKLKKNTNIKYLTGEAAKTRLIQCQEEKRRLEKKIYKLRKSLQKYVESKSVSVSADLSNDLSKIFKDNYDKMTPVQKLFWGEQLKSISKQNNPRQMRWNPFIIKVALHIQMVSTAAYDYLTLFLNLPSQRTLYDFTHYVDATEGPQEVIMQEMQQKVKETCSEQHQSFFNLIFDEMDIHSDIVISRRTGEIIGYAHLSKVEEELKTFEASFLQGSEVPTQPAQKVLAYLALGVTNTLQDVVAVYTTSGKLTSGQLFKRTWDVVYRMESYDLKVLCLICDGAPLNKKFFRMNAKYDQDCNTIYATKNIACGEDRPLFFIVDPVHVLKSLRNNFANSGAHKKSRRLWKNGEPIVWTVIEILFDLIRKLKYVETKLTKAHVKLTAHSCMKVIYAAQVMSLSVVAALKYFQDDPAMKNHCLDELCHFIRLVNNWFDCLNGSTDTKGKRNKENRYLEPYTDENDERFEFLGKKFIDFFDKWYEDVQKRPGRFSKENRERMFISMLTYESLHITSQGFIHAVKFMLKMGASSIDARKFNQDKLEQFFGLLRMCFGGNRNPTASQVFQKVLTLHVQGEAAKPPSTGNTQVVRQEWIPDESKLPKRQRRQREDEC